MLLRALIAVGLFGSILTNTATAQTLIHTSPAEPTLAAGAHRVLYLRSIYRELEDANLHPSKDVIRLTHRVNIGANDRRASMSDYSAVFSPAMQATLNRISGRVTCKMGRSSSYAEARIIEDSQQIVTNAHVLADEGQLIPHQLPSCYFVTKANPKKKVALDLREGFYHLGSRAPHKDTRRDFALVRLKESVGNVQIPKTGPPPIVGETVYMVSHEAEGATRRIDLEQLVAQDCKAHFLQGGDDTRIGYFVTDCSSLQGDSGASYYAFRNGAIEAVGFEVGGGFASANGKPYDVSNPDPKLRSFSLGLTFDQRLLDASRSLAERAKGIARARGEHAEGGRNR